MKKKLRNTAIVLLLILPCSEIAARLIGWTPYQNTDYKVQVSPGFWLVGDSLLGLQLNPGVYGLALNKTVHFSVTHAENKVRELVAPQPKGGDEVSNEVYMFGCSFTYGYGVNDYEVFTNLLQEKHPKSRFTNYAVPGYGTVQPLIQLEQKIEEGKAPSHAILVYSKVHHERNALSNSYRRALRIGFSRSNKDVDGVMRDARIPYRILTDKKVYYSPWNELYSHWAGRERFAVVHALQSTLEKEIDEVEQMQITGTLLNEFIQLCRANTIVPVIVNLDDKEFDLIALEGKPKVINIGFDFTDPKLTNLPHDIHPNAAGHQLIATKIDNILQYLLNE